MDTALVGGPEPFRPEAMTERGLRRSFSHGRIENLESGLVHACRMEPAEAGHGTHYLTACGRTNPGFRFRVRSPSRGVTCRSCAVEMAAHGYSFFFGNAYVYPRRRD